MPGAPSGGCGGRPPPERGAGGSPGWVLPPPSGVLARRRGGRAARDGSPGVRWRRRDGMIQGGHGTPPRRTRGLACRARTRTEAVGFRCSPRAPLASGTWVPVPPEPSLLDASPMSLPGHDRKRSRPDAAPRTDGAEAEAHESLLYGELSKVYDLIFARVFYPRIARTIRQLKIPAGSRVLEIGVGTGLSLAAYPRHCRVLGLDRSPEMLKHARKKIDRMHLRHIRLVEGDALHLPFEAASFDYAMAFHVITVVPDHERLLAEARRVLRPGGTLVVINHFRSKSAWLSRFEKNLEPLSKRWGWATLDVSEATAHMGDPVLHRRGPRRGALFTVLVARQPGEGARR